LRAQAARPASLNSVTNSGTCSPAGSCSDGRDNSLSPFAGFAAYCGEARSLDRQLVHFAWLWFFSNTGYQVFWEMPWFLMKDTLMSGTITMQDTLFWPWWAYGVADTRYLQVNDLILGIEAMDGAFALFEVACIYFFLKGYRVFVAWVALILGSCMGWGQYYFYIGEIYTYFEKIQDGWFGFYIKFWLMGFPWLLYPVIAAFGFIWYLSAIYKRQAIEEYTSGRKPEFGKSFLRETDMLLTVSEYGERVEETANQSMIRKLILVAFAWPFVFLAIDIYRFYN